MSVHDGHRSRISRKLDTGALEEHEWLEVLLFNGIARKNTNEIAHALIEKYGTALDALLSSTEELRKVPGVGIQVAAYLRCIGHFYEHYQKRKKPKYVGKFEPYAFMSFAKAEYKDVVFEVVDLYLLDGDGNVMKQQRFSIDSIATVTVVPEEISTFLLTEGASGAVMVHNHPFGEATPSTADDRMTKNCQMLCSMHNRLLCEHIICASNGMYSYYLSGRMSEISKNYSVSNFLE